MSHWYISAIASNCSIHSGKFLRTTNFIVFVDYTPVSKMNSLQNYSTYIHNDSLVDPQNLCLDERKFSLKKFPATTYTV